MEAPILVSANAFRRRDGAGFKLPRPDTFSGCDVALDSAGFVAMLRYGGYPWSVRDYVRLAGAFPWAWWAAMDYCCEPQIARDPAEVARRIALTARMLKGCQEEAARAGVRHPLPVLQGWHADDYLRCFDHMSALPLPDVMGLGSVCRRHLGGTDGVLHILSRLDRELPRGKTLHLFGVKGTAISELAGHPRVHSVDSMAWDAAARREKAGSCTVDHRSTHLCRWYEAQRRHLARPQLRLAV
ncbi:hypothetical protein FHP25_35955 [Vineibacter terrae]|uniref:DeoxyPurine in DNA protein A domain-containing protein n=1 Tax=Vineibacter terrae TaxID=2586908 RepID=A0A5C8P9B4_9HYPH|nr:hypothetical protein [Vineibacter terrae]TXL70119.1 hypothetical protein FHP25_35955 [Vineibacter terrae]